MDFLLALFYLDQKIKSLKKTRQTVVFPKKTEPERKVMSLKIETINHNRGCLHSIIWITTGVATGTAGTYYSIQNLESFGLIMTVGGMTQLMLTFLNERLDLRLIAPCSVLGGLILLLLNTSMSPDHR
ncbi:MAG: hypothetical protein WDZ28_00245 [Simkaniaceae bacterium]